MFLYFFYKSKINMSGFVEKHSVFLIFNSFQTIKHAFVLDLSKYCTNLLKSMHCGDSFKIHDEYLFSKFYKVSFRSPNLLCYISLPFFLFFRNKEHKSIVKKE